MTTSTEPSDLIQNLFLVPPLLSSYTAYEMGSEMMSRQSKVRALAKLTPSRNFDILYVVTDDGKEETSKILFSADDGIVHQIWAGLRGISIWFPHVDGLVTMRSGNLYVAERAALSLIAVYDTS